MREREPLKVRDVAGTIASLSFLIIMAVTAKSGWNAVLGFFTAAGAAAAINHFLQKL